AFALKYKRFEFRRHPLSIRGFPEDREQAEQHRKEAASLRRVLARHPFLASLALEGLPGFQRRTGAADDKVLDLFAIETANLILARILLIRFLEDHGFLGQKKYVCNGGVEA